jgi:archaellum component FlaC
VQVVKNLPTILGDVSQKLKNFVEEVFNIAGSTIVEEIKIIVQNVRNFVDGIQQDVLKFYNVRN